MRYTAPQKIHESASAPPHRRLDLKQVQYAWPVEMPLCKSLASGLWEVRSALTGGKIARVLFCFHEEHLYALHGFIKKSQKTPPSDLSLTLKRKRMIENDE
jgi:phage-related protein